MKIITSMICMLLLTSIKAQIPSELWGVTYYGGISSAGVLFNYSLDSNIYKLKANIANAGVSPSGGLLLASNGKFYGVTEQGGPLGYGTLYEYDPATSIIAAKVTFLIPANGKFPTGDLIEVNGKLYGTTYSGGSSGSYGTLFEYNPATNTFTKKIDFITWTGGSPRCGMMQATNGKLYGVTSDGSAKGIYEYNVATNTYTHKANMGINIGADVLEKMVQAPNGKLYGLASQGGVNGFSSFGVLFEYDITTNIYTKKFEFDGLDGKSPNGGLCLAPNGKLYGMTVNGGLNDQGVIFEYDPNTGIYIKKLDFNGVGNGSHPFGSFIVSADGTKLYGETYAGGANVSGTIFSYDYTSNTLTNLHNFGNSLLGTQPKTTHLLEICAPVTASLQGVSQNLCSGSSYSMTATATGTNLSYQWYLNNNPIAGATTNSFNINSITTLDNGNYYCKVTNGCRNVNTNSVSLTVPVGTYTQNYVLCPGQEVTIGTNTYNATGTYTDQLISVMGCDSTIITSVVVNNLIDTSTSVSGLTITSNEIGASFQWVDCNTNFSFISGATNSIYTATANGNYAVIIYKSGCSDTSACVAITSTRIKEMKRMANWKIIPNPAFDEIAVNYLLNETSNVKIELYNSIGVLVSTFEKNNQQKESYNYYINTTENPLVSGVYFIRLYVNEYVETRRVVILD